MYKRFELHNHTTESDASNTCRELIAHMCRDKVDAFAITDHNTISGHRKIKQILAESQFSIECIYGMEYTTYYGHILCLNLEEYVPWETINFHKPELLFRAVKEKGALAGIAHPYSFGHPFARGCGFDMTVTDYSAVDFIEIFNNPEPLYEVNEKGLLLWERLVLDGWKLAMTSGMDLHGLWDMGNQFATYVPEIPGKTAAQELKTAIHTQTTCISKGLLLHTSLDREKRTVAFSLEDTHKPGYAPKAPDAYLVTVKTRDKTTVHAINEPVSLEQLGSPALFIPKLYEQDTRLEHLICVGSAVHCEDKL